MRTAFEPEGDVRSVDLPAAFASLWRQRASGVLRFSRARQTVRFEILSGDVVGVFPSDPAFETAEVLIRAGKLDAAALEGERIPEGVDRAAAARQLGHLSERDWRWGEKIRMVEILSDLTGWLDGSYEFDRNAVPEPGEFRLGVQRLLLELFLRSHDRAFVHHALGAPDAPLHRADDFDEGFATLGLTAEAAPVIAAIDGRATAADISRRMPPDPFSVEKLLAALATLGLVHPEYAAETPPAIKRGRVAPASLPAPPAKTPPPPPPPAPPEWEAEPEPAPEFVLPAEPPPPAPEPLVVPEPPPRLDDEIAKRHVEAEPEPEPEIELPLAPPPLPSEPEPAVRDWEQSAPGPMDQPLALPEPPELLRSSRSSRPGLSFVWLLVILAAGVAALLVFRSRGGEPDDVRAAAATASSRAGAPANVSPGAGAPATISPVATEATPSALPSGLVAETPSLPVVAATALPTFAPPEPTAVLPTPSPAPSPAPTAAALVQPPSPPPAGRAAWVARAREDRRRVEGDASARYTIQLELVCELPSVEEAWVFDRGGQMWLATASHGGRPCFRVFWGRYGTLEEARRAKDTVPRFFFTPTNRPVVVATERALLP